MEIIASRAGVLPAPLETLKIGKPLGRGGFATVKSGTLKTADGSCFPVAVKVLHPEYSDDSSPELRLFKEEAQLMLQLDHRNIIVAYGLLKLPPQFAGLEGHSQPAFALVLELMEGGSLASLMVKQLLAGVVPKYTFSQALGWVIDVARALQYLHKGGKDGFPRIHRDVKLENVLLTAGMRTAKLADFGLQRAIFIQQEETQPMLVRRSQRPPPGSMLPAARTGPAGPSRLAPESDRLSSRPNSAAAQGMVVSRGPSMEHPPGADDGNPLFYAVDGKGLTPLALPGSPRTSSFASPVASQLPGPPVVLEDVSERPEKSGVARRSASVPQLEQGPLRDLEQGGGSQRRSCSVAEAARMAGPAAGGDGNGDGGGGCQQVMPGQLLSAGSCIVSNGGSTLHITSRRTMAITPPLPERPAAVSSRLALAPSPRSLGTGLCSPIAVRPSPLGPAAARPVRTAEGNGGSSPWSPTDGAPPTPELPAAGERFAISSERGRSVDASGNHGTGTSVAPIASTCSDGAAADWPASARAATPTQVLLQSGSGGRGASGSDGASTRDVVLSDLMVSQAPPGVGSFAPSSTLHAASARRIAPGAASGGGVEAGGAASGVVEPVSGGAVGGLSPLPAGSSSRCRLQVLAVTDMSSSEQEGVSTVEQQLGTGGGAAGNLHQHRQQHQQQLLPGSANAETQAPITPGHGKVTFAVDLGGLASSPNSTPLKTTDTGMAGGGKDAAAGGGGEAAARAWLKLPNTDTHSGRELAKVVSSKAAAAAAVAAAGGDDGSASGIPPQLVDLLHMRLGALQVSVRSMRASASGIALQKQCSSGASSPRLAAAMVAGRPVATSVDWSGGEGGAGPGGGGSRRPRVGSLPGRSLDKEKGISRAPVADFEEVFSLTGRTGSLMYLAPEAYKNEPYNDKVDVYSLAILMYELFGRTSITYTHISTKLPAFSRMLCNPDEFAERVAAGYRPPRTNQMAKMPPALWELIEAGWHQDPVQRPDVDTLVEALEELVEPLAEAEAGKGKGKGQLAAPTCGCVIC